MGGEPPLRAILFDKDGTLIDVNTTSARFCERLVRKLGKNDPEYEASIMQALGYDPETRELKMESVVIAGSADEIVDVLSSTRSDLSQTQIDAAAREALLDLPVEALGDVEAVLKALLKNGYRLGVATNDYESAARAQLSRIGLFQEFEFICGSDSGFGSKPDPEIVNAFARHIGCSTAQIVMVGDSLHDIKLGVQAGCGAIIGVTTGYTSKDVLAEDATTVISTLEDLPEVLMHHRIAELSG